MTTTQFIIIVLIVLFAPAVLAGWLCYRAGVRRGLTMLTYSYSRLKEIDPVLAQVEAAEVREILQLRYSLLAEEGPIRLASILSSLSVEYGMNMQSRILQPPNGEVQVTMPKEDFRHLARLASDGLRVWIGGTLTEEQAVKFANIIQTLESKAARPNPTREEKERCIDNGFNLMTAIWRAYPSKG